MCPLSALPGTDLSEVLHRPPSASLPFIRDIRQIVKSARNIVTSVVSEILKNFASYFLFSTSNSSLFHSFFRNKFGGLSAELLRSRGGGGKGVLNEALYGEAPQSVLTFSEPSFCVIAPF